MTSPPAPETARVRAHLEGALAEVSAHTPDLSPSQRTARARALADLRAYIDAENYPTNDVMPGRTPIFVDRFGARCAMAALIEASGHEDLVARVARDHLYAHIMDLAADAELRTWLDEHGLTLAEAARIQPEYANETTTGWKATASVVASAQVGVDGRDFAAWGLVGARIGARRITHWTGACDHCVVRSLAVVGEYERRLAPSAGDGNFVAGLFQYELDDHGEDHQFYAIGGPVVAVGDAVHVGAKAGLGFSLRSRAQPILGEVGVIAIDDPDGFSARVGLTVGAVW